MGTRRERGDRVPFDGMDILGGKRSLADGLYGCRRVGSRVCGVGVD